MKRFVHYSLLLLALLSGPMLDAQEIESEVRKMYLIETFDGNTIRGRIIESNEEYMLIETESGEFKIFRDKIKNMELDEYKGKYRFANAHASRYFFGPSAFQIPKGQFNYRNFMLSTNAINYGISDYVSVGAGVELISLFQGYPIYSFNVKVGGKVAENHALGGGIMFIGAADFGVTGLVYGNYTLGNEDNNMTVGLGFPTAEDISTAPVGMLAFSLRLSNAISLKSESYILGLLEEGDFAEDLVLLSVLGIRIHSRKNAFDAGLLLNTTGELPVLPVVGYSRAF